MESSLLVIGDLRSHRSALFVTVIDTPINAFIAVDLDSDCSPTHAIPQRPMARFI